MSKLFSGYVCVSDLIDQAKKGHSAFTKSEKNGKVYANILIWENDEADKFSQTHAIQLNSTKEKKDAEGKIYIGNAKPIEQKPPTESDLPKDGWDSNVQTREQKSEAAVDEPKDDLPF